MGEHGFSELNRLLELAMAYRKSKPLLVALHYGLFEHLDAASSEADALACKLDLDPRALTILLEALVALDLLKKNGARYANTVAARRFLVPRSPDYIGHNLRYQEHTWEAWSELKHVVKSGRPNLALIDWIHRDIFREDYIRAMGDVARWPARDLAAKLDLRDVERTLDVGCGAGTYSAALVDRNPGIEATLLDLPTTLNVTKKLLRAHPHADRLKFHAADFLTDSFGTTNYDLVLISNVTHVESAVNNLRLVEKAWKALVPGGRLVIHDYVANHAITPSKFAAMLSLHLLVFTGKGNVYTLGDYVGWMRGKGFKRITHKPVASGSLYSSVAIIGRKS